MRRNRVFAAMLAVLMVVSLTACGRESVGTPGGELENGVAAIEDAMTTKPVSYPHLTLPTIYYG